jgi:hypothetical protein
LTQAIDEFTITLTSSPLSKEGPSVLLRIACAITILLGGVGFGLVTASPAAAAGTISCSVTQTTTYDPAVDQDRRSTTITVTRNYQSCTGLTGSPAITSGTSTTAHTADITCGETAGSEFDGRNIIGQVPFTIVWNTGATSTLNGTTRSNGVVDIISGYNAYDNITMNSEGAVTSGKFSGATVGGIALPASLYTLSLSTGYWSDETDKWNLCSEFAEWGSNYFPISSYAASGTLNIVEVV